MHSLSSSTEGLRDGLRGGPIVMFDGAGSVMILSAYSQFMAHNMEYNDSSGQMHFGVMGGVDSIPPDFQV